MEFYALKKFSGIENQISLLVDWGKCFKIPSSEIEVMPPRLGNEKLAFVFFHEHFNSGKLLHLNIRLLRPSSEKVGYGQFPRDDGCKVIRNY